MPGVQKFEHAHLRVTDLEETTRFYRDAMNLVPVDERDGVKYFSCGLDENYDIAIEEGGSGLHHLAIRVNDESELNAYEQRIEERNVETERTDGAEVSQTHGLRFDLPSSEVTIELVTVGDKRYKHSEEAVLDGRTAITPFDADHITIGSPDVKKDVRFLQDVLDFNVSDVIHTGSDEWKGAFTRFGDHHHDLALMKPPSGSEFKLAHFAWQMKSVEHIKMLADNLSHYGIELELGINRHRAGDNLFAYFWTPGGNRFELCAEMATLDDSTPTTYYDAKLESEENSDSYSSWEGSIPPKSFYEEGS